jgi:hypothetical protein
MITSKHETDRSEATNWSTHRAPHLKVVFRSHMSQNTDVTCWKQEDSNQCCVRDQDPGNWNLIIVITSQIIRKLQVISPTSEGSFKIFLIPEDKPLHKIGNLIIIAFSIEWRKTIRLLNSKQNQQNQQASVTDVNIYKIFQRITYKTWWPQKQKKVMTSHHSGNVGKIKVITGLHIMHNMLLFMFV